MELKEQVCNLELAKKLKQLRVKQESYFIWLIKPDSKDFEIMPSGVFNEEQYSAFTVAELGDMLMKPLNITCGYSVIANMYVCHYDRKMASSMDKNLADCLAKMLIYVIKQKLINL